jgi:hypothetical protein
MDQQRFDDLTRAMAAGTTRRRALKVFGGLAAGIGAMRFADRSALAGGCEEEGNACASEADCCQGLFCSNFVCSSAEICGVAGDPCPVDFSAGVRATLTPDCCTGFVCGLGGVCVSICAEEGDGCETSDDCCEDLVCSEGVCVVPALCAEEGGSCEGDADCCEGICCAGSCRNIECCIDEEDPNARCPEGTSCFEGICDEVICGGEGAACDDSSECCGELVCYKGTCAVPRDDDDDDHDGGGEHGGGVREPVTQLPSTGVAGEDGRDGLIAGAVLAAGTAALLAGKKLAPKPFNETPN